MIRTIIKIDKNKCNGCGICVQACHEGAIGLVSGKAKLLRESYCDGLGDCLPSCPTGAISFEKREAPAYDEAAVKANQAKQTLATGCPGSQMKTFQHTQNMAPSSQLSESMLSQWPVQIKLIPINAPCFENSNLLIAADCTAFAYANFHQQFMRNHITLIGCPKLDQIEYSEKLTEIIRNHSIKNISIVRMEVPCCKGIENAVKTAIQQSGKFLPWQVSILSTDGKILEN